jgi:hypothetical protein
MRFESPRGRASDAHGLVVSAVPCGSGALAATGPACRRYAIPTAPLSTPS